jgi:hypothetical protein
LCAAAKGDHHGEILQGVAMTQNELSAIAIAIFVGFALLRGIFRMLRSLLAGDSGRTDRSRMDRSQIDRIGAAAKKVLAERERAMRSSAVPTTQGNAQRKNAIGTAAKAKARPVRSTAAAKKPQSASAALLAQTRSPAVVRRGLFGGKEPVIQRRR